MTWYNVPVETQGSGAVAFNSRANYSNIAPAVWANAPRLRLDNDGTQREFSIMRPGPKPQTPKCHPERKLKGRGLCVACYNKLYTPKWRADHKEQIKLSGKQWQIANAAHVKELKRAWRLANPEKVKEQKRRAYERNPNSVKARALRWKVNNPDRVRDHNDKRRAAKAGSGNSATAIERDWRLVLFGNACAYCCGAFEHLDHVVALANQGGDHAGNLVPSCRRCNTTKGTRDWREWFQSTPWHDAKREKFISQNIW